ncbi:histone H1-III-like [Penaeus vannamei]|uniref:histone H1-III-like n=1 Tax=Penaeus vannamei TaxID=6689 RepID=UPI00387F92B3
MAPVEKSEANGEAQKEQKKRGRPKGAKNKATVLSSLALTPKSNGEAQKRGRPKVAKKKSTVPSSKIVKAKTSAKKRQPKAKVVGKRGRPRTKTGAENPVKFVDLVLRAFQALDNRKGSSLQAIKKYLKENDGLDAQKKAVYINKSIRKLTEDGTIRHRIGVGARGTFKLVEA